MEPILEDRSHTFGIFHIPHLIPGVDPLYIGISKQLSGEGLLHFPGRQVEASQHLLIQKDLGI